MKPELTVLPLEVWADVFESPLITRQKLAQIADGIGNRKFTEKLQKLLHGCGKHSLRFLSITSQLKENPSKYQLLERKIPEYQASLGVSPHATIYGHKTCEFPESEMPENITKFKQLSIGHLDDKVLDFLNKIKPLFTNVFLDIKAIQSAGNLRILLAHLLPMLDGIRGICCADGGIQLFARQFRAILALARELKLSYMKPALIPAYLDWLCAPQDFVVDGPRFLVLSADSKTIFAVVNAVRKQFLTATTPSTFVAFLEFNLHADRHKRAEECTIQNAATKEQLTVRNTNLNVPVYGANIPYVEIMRHPMGDEAKMREWMKERAYFDKKYKEMGHDGHEEDDGENQVILINELTIGRITNIAGRPMNQDEEEQPVEEDDASRPSTSQQHMDLDLLF